MSIRNPPIGCRVRYSGGAYNTTRVLGQSASSTSGAEEAVRRLAAKLAGHGLGPVDYTLRHVPPLPDETVVAGCGLWFIEQAASAEAPPPPQRHCRACTYRAWSGSGQSYDCNAAAGTPLPHEHHDGVVPNWCPLASRGFVPPRGAPGSV